MATVVGLLRNRSAIEKMHCLALGGCVLPTLVWVLICREPLATAFVINKLANDGLHCASLTVHSLSWVTALFEGADKSQDGLLSRDEIMKMARLQNMGVSTVSGFRNALSVSRSK